MAQSTLDLTSTGYRGRSDHAVRRQIVDAARERFSQDGYANVAVADVAKTIGFSKAYIYKFFDSKRAIGEALCTQIMEVLLDKAQHASRKGATSSERLSLYFLKLVDVNVALCKKYPRLADIALDAMRERWAPSVAYVEAVERFVSTIVQQGQVSGEFHARTPPNEAGRAIARAMEIYYNPLVLQFKLDELPKGPHEILRLLICGLSR